MTVEPKLWFGTIVLVALLGCLARQSQGQTKNSTAQKSDKDQPVPTARQVLMRDKLTFANQALEGLSIENFGKIGESAEMMRIISKAASWYVIRTDEYDRYSKNFQEEAADLGRHAKEKNLEAAALDYVRITMTCVQCHKYVRDVRSKEKR